MRKYFFAVFCMCLLFPFALTFAACSTGSSKSDSEITNYTVSIGESGSFAGYDLNKTGNLTFVTEDQYNEVTSHISHIKDFVVVASYADGTTKKISSWSVQRDPDSYDLRFILNGEEIAIIHVMIGSYSVTIADGSGLDKYYQDNKFVFSSQSEYDSIYEMMRENNFNLTCLLGGETTTIPASEFKMQRSHNSLDLEFYINYVMVCTIPVEIQAPVVVDETVKLECEFGGISPTSEAQNIFVLDKELRYTGDTINPLGSITIKETPTSQAEFLNVWLEDNNGKLKITNLDGGEQVARTEANNYSLGEYDVNEFLITPDTNCTWGDGSTDPIHIQWVIKRQILSTPRWSYSEPLTFAIESNNGSLVAKSQCPEVDYFDNENFFTPIQPQQYAGTYSGEISILDSFKSNYCLLIDGEEEERDSIDLGSWEIKPMVLDVANVEFSSPENVNVTYNENQIPLYTYTGGEIKPSVNVAKYPSLFNIPQNGFYDVSSAPYSFVVGFNLSNNLDDVVLVKLDTQTQVAYARNYVWSNGSPIKVADAELCEDGFGFISNESWTYQFYIVKADSILPSDFDANLVEFTSIEYNGQDSFTLNLTQDEVDSSFTNATVDYLNGKSMFAGDFSVGNDNTVSLTIGENDITLYWYAGTKANFNPAKIFTKITLTPMTIILLDNALPITDKKDGTARIESIGSIEAKNGYGINDKIASEILAGFSYAYYYRLNEDEEDEDEDEEWQVARDFGDAGQYKTVATFNQNKSNYFTLKKPDSNESITEFELSWTVAPQELTLNATWKLQHTQPAEEPVIDTFSYLNYFEKELGQYETLEHVCEVSLRDSNSEDVELASLFNTPTKKTFKLVGDKWEETTQRTAGVYKTELTYTFKNEVKSTNYLVNRGTLGRDKIVISTEWEIYPNQISFQTINPEQPNFIGFNYSENPEFVYEDSNYYPIASAPEYVNIYYSVVSGDYDNIPNEVGEYEIEASFTLKNLFGVDATTVIVDDSVGSEGKNWNYTTTISYSIVESQAK